VTDVAAGLKLGAVARGSKIWDDAIKRLARVARLRVHVGVLASKGGAEHPVDEEGNTSDLSLVEIAAVHEFGSPAAHVPERSFVRSTFRVHARDQLRAKMTVLCRAALNGRMDPGAAIDLLGSWAATAIRNSITRRLIKQDLRPATIRRKTVGGKKGDTALVDTGQLMNAITWEIDENTGGGS